MILISCVTRSGPKKQAAQSALLSLSGGPLSYLGAFIVNPAAYGGSAPEFDGQSTRPKRAFDISENGSTIYVTANHRGTSGSPRVGQFEYPVPSTTSDLNSVPVAANLQPYVDTSSRFSNLPVRTGGGNDHVVTSAFEINGKLLAGWYSYYNSNNDDGYNVGVFDDPSDLANSTTHGCYRINGAARSGALYSRIPAEFQSEMGGDLITCAASGMAINSRASQGPNLFVMNSSDITQTTPPTDISATALINFNYEPQLTPTQTLQDFGTEPEHTTKSSIYTSQIWNCISHCAGVFLIPGTRTILAVGSGWAKKYPDSYLNYKFDAEEPRSDGSFTNGYAAYYVDDYDSFYWLWDLDAVLANSGNPWDVPPYEWGRLDLTSCPFVTTHEHIITGADYDYTNGRLLCHIDNAAEPRFSSTGLVAAFDLGVS